MAEGNYGVGRAGFAFDTVCKVSALVERFFSFAVLIHIPS